MPESFKESVITAAIKVTRRLIVDIRMRMLLNVKRNENRKMPEPK